MHLAEHLDSSYMYSDPSVSKRYRTSSRDSERTFSNDSDVPSKALSGINSSFVFAGDRSTLRFNRTCNVVLIPSRIEFKQADCDLWWQREDFVSFQQSACSELRMLCNIDNIGVREARRRLYQPETAEDAEKRGLNDLGSESRSGTMSTSSSTYSLQSLDEADSSQQDDDGELFSWGASPSAMTVPPSPSKLSLRVFQSAGNLAELARQHDMENDDLLSEAIPSLPQDDHWNLQLCVVLQRQIPLVLEAPSSPSSGRRSSREPPDADSGLIAVMGFCSFALPLVGYFFFNSRFSFFQTFS